MEGDAAGISASASRIFHFYPRPPGGGRLFSGIGGLDIAAISIHALRVEGDGYRPLPDTGYSISIHALRVEGDCEDYAGNFGQAMISIHALRVEGDLYYHSSII